MPDQSFFAFPQFPAAPSRPRRVAPRPARRAAAAVGALAAVVLGASVVGRPAAAAVPGVPAYDHVFIVIEENHSYSATYGSAAPYLTSLANQGGVATNYQAISHPSLPNYLALVSGSTQGVHDDGTSYVFTTPSIVDRLTAAGKTWGGYMEDMPSPCFNGGGSGNYAKKHDPFMYFSSILNTPSQCNRVVPFTQLATDLKSAASTPNYVWITPNLCNDMHDCSVATGDGWAKQNFPTIFNSPAWKTQRSLLIVTWDEGSGNNQVETLMTASDGSVPAGTKSATGYTHYSLLRTVEAAWGLQAAGSGDAAAAPMADFFGPGAVQPPPPPATVPASVPAPAQQNATTHSAPAAVVRPAAPPVVASHRAAPPAPPPQAVIPPPPVKTPQAAPRAAPVPVLATKTSQLISDFYRGMATGAVLVAVAFGAVVLIARRRRARPVTAAGPLTWEEELVLSGSRQGPPSRPAESTSWQRVDDASVLYFDEAPEEALVTAGADREPKK